MPSSLIFKGGLCPTFKKKGGGGGCVRGGFCQGGGGGFCLFPVTHGIAEQ